MHVSMLKRINKYKREIKIQKLKERKKERKKEANKQTTEIYANKEKNKEIKNVKRRK